MTSVSDRTEIRFRPVESEVSAALHRLADHLDTISVISETDVRAAFDLVTALGSNSGPYSAKVILSEIRAMLVRELVAAAGDQISVARELGLSHPVISRMLKR